MFVRALFLACALVSIAQARPQNANNPRQAYILKHDYDNSGYGGYSFNVDTSDGFHHDQTGELKNAGTDDEYPEVYGHYSYIGADGNTYYVEYIANKDGFQPAGDHIPKSAGVGKVGQLGIPSAAIASLAGGGLG